MTRCPGSRRDDHHEESDSSADDAAGAWSDAGVAAARRHDSGADRTDAYGGKTRPPLRRHVRRERHDHGPVDAVGRGSWLRAVAGARVARPTPRSVLGADALG